MLRKKLLLTFLVMAAASFFATNVMAATSVQWSSPPPNTAFAVGTNVSVMGNAVGQGAVGGNGLDLVLVMDDSGSMDYYGYVDDQQNAAKALVENLPQATTSVAVVQFGVGGSQVLGLTQLNGTNTAVNNAIMSVNGDQSNTSIHGGINAAAPILNSSSNPNRLQAMVVMSDGGSSASSADSAADSAVLSGTEAIHTVGMGLSSGTTTLQAVVNGANDTYGDGDDYGTYNLASDIDSLVGLFSGTGGNLVGLDHIDITDPDGVVHTNWALDNGLGDFHIDWALTLGANIFTVKAYGTDNTTAEATITLYGTTNTVPEPTTMVLFGFGLLGLAGVSRRKK